MCVCITSLLYISKVPCAFHPWNHGFTDMRNKDSTLYDKLLGALIDMKMNPECGYEFSVNCFDLLWFSC